MSRTADSIHSRTTGAGRPLGFVVALVTAAGVLGMSTPASPQDPPSAPPSSVEGGLVLRHSLADGTTGPPVRPKRRLSLATRGNTAGLQVQQELSIEQQALICCPPDNRYPIFDTTVFPYTTVCKVIVQFPSTNVYIGSAVMVGARHALTAGHVIYSAEDGGWATSVRVAPGYDDGYEPFGHVFANYLYSFVGYTQFEDLNYDFGMLEFGTDIGDSTGWLGYASLSDSTLKGSTLNTAGFPGDLYNGERMYAANGPCLDVSARQVYYAGTMDTAGGQSGSGVWRFDGTNRYVVAVHTFGSPSFNGGTRINSDVFDYIEYVKNGSGDTPPDPDPPPPPGSTETLNVYTLGCSVRDDVRPGRDRAKVRAFYFFNESAGDSLINPIGDGITIRIDAAGEPTMELTLPALDSNWKVRGRRKAVWNGYIGLTRVRFTMDTFRQVLIAKVDWFDLDVPPENPITVSILCGNDYGTAEHTWFEKRPGFFRF